MEYGHFYKIRSLTASIRALSIYGGTCPGASRGVVKQEVHSSCDGPGQWFPLLSDLEKVLSIIGFSPTNKDKIQAMETNPSITY